MRQRPSALLRLVLCVAMILAGIQFAAAAPPASCCCTEQGMSSQMHCKGDCKCFADKPVEPIKQAAPAPTVHVDFDAALLPEPLTVNSVETPAVAIAGADDSPPPIRPPPDAAPRGPPVR